MKGISTFVYTNDDLILAKSHHHIMEFDETRQAIHIHGFSGENEAFVRKLVENYGTIHYEHEGLLTATNLLEAAHFADTYLKYNRSAQLVYWGHRNSQPRPLVQNRGGFRILIFRYGDWPSEKDQFRLLRIPGFRFARITSYPDQTIELMVASKILKPFSSRPQNPTL